MPNRYDYRERSHDDKLDTDSDVLQLQHLLIRQALAGQHACYYYQTIFVPMISISIFYASLRQKKTFPPEGIVG
jgi:hypothetical protein